MKKLQQTFLKCLLSAGLIVFTLAFANIANAQTWDAPSLKSSDPVTGTAYYIYNIGAEGFLTRGGSWGSQANISAKPIANGSANLITWTAVNTSGSEWTFKYTVNGAQSQAGVDDDFVAAQDDTGGSVFTDQGSGWGSIVWTLQEDGTTNNYTFQVPSSFTNYNSSAFLGTEAAAESSNVGYANAVRWNKTSNDDYVKWKFISQANYELYQAKVMLDRYLRYASAKGGITLTDYITTYDSDVTANINTDAATLLAALNRTDATSSISNADFANGLTDWTNTGSFVTNDWTTPPGWTRGGILIEKYVGTARGSVGNLSTGALTQTLTGLTNGLYEVAFDAHAVQQAGSNPLHTGAFLKAGAKSTEVSAGGGYTVDMVEVSNGTLTIGYYLEGTVACNWTAFDSFKLYYYGASSVASDDALLSGIQVGDGVLVPAFSAEVTNYSVTLPSSASTVDVNATRNHSSATFKINDATAADAADQAVALTSGSGTANIVVTAEDGSTTKTYTVTFVGKSSTLNHSYTFADGTADDMVGSADGTAGGSSLTIANGAATVAGASTYTSGYITLPASTLALSGYSAVTIEAYIKAGTTNSSYTMLAYFGNNTGGDKSFWFQPSISGTASRAAVNNTNPTATSATELNDGNYHHIVATLTSTTLEYYLDGTNQQITSTGGTNYITGIDNVVANLFRGPDGWKDKNYDASIYEFNIYDGELASSEILANATSFVNKGHDATLTDIKVNDVSLAGFASGTYTYEVKLNEGDAVPTIVGVLADGNATKSQVDATSVPGSTIITVTAEDGKTLGIYTLNFVTQSADATLSALSVDSGLFFYGSFDAQTTSYEVLVPAGISTVNVTAVKNHSAAAITSGDGAIDVSGGSTSTDVLVTAEDGSTKTYTINFTVSTTNYIFGWDGNTITGTGTSPFDFGWENTAGYSSASDVNGCCGARIRSNYSGYTYEDGGATVTGRQQLLRYDGTTAEESAAWIYPVTLAANTVYDFTFDYVYGGSGTAPATLTVGIGTANDAVSDIASKGYETSSDATKYRSGSLTFMTSAAGVYYVKFTVSERSWQGINNLIITTSDVIGWNGAWSNAVGPNANGSDNVLVASALTVSNDIAVNNLEVGSNGSITLESGAALAIMGAASGNATIKRNTTGSAGYSMVGAPVSGATLDDLAADYLYDYIENSDSWSANLKASTDAMTPGKGFFVGYDAVTPEVSLSGALVSGDQSATITSGGDGWNIVANPYAAAISSDDFIANATNTSNTTGSLYIWDDGGANNGTLRAGSYVVANNSNSKNIGSSQGFFVQAQTGATAVDFTPSMQVTTAGANADANYYRKASVGQKLKLTLTGNQLYNEVVVSLNEVATEGVDYGWDAKFLVGNEFMSFYTLLDGEKYATQGLAQEAQSVDLGMDLKEAGSYAITAAEFEGFDGMSAQLVDNTSGKTYELGKNVVVPFTAEALTSSKRFSVVFAPAKVLGSSVLNNNLQVLGGNGELTINFASNNTENVSIYSMDGRMMFNGAVKFNANKAVISPSISRNQVYVLRVNNESVKFILK